MGCVEIAIRVIIADKTPILKFGGFNVFLGDSAGFDPMYSLLVKVLKN